MTVSYTHLDVYKRQGFDALRQLIVRIGLFVQDLCYDRFYVGIKPGKELVFGKGQKFCTLIGPVNILRDVCIVCVLEQPVVELQEKVGALTSVPACNGQDRADNGGQAFFRAGIGTDGCNQLRFQLIGIALDLIRQGGQGRDIVIACLLYTSRCV